MADFLRETPMQNPIMGLLADRLKKVQEFGAKPFGYENPPVEMLMNLLGIPAVQQTMERMAYGEPLTTGRGMTTKPRPEAVEAAMAVAPVVGLLGKTTEKAAMAAGRAGEKYAEKVVPQIMERGGLPAEMVQAMGANTRSLLDVYHGTPHRFPPTAKNPLGEFDASKIGTGEGAQVYGHGIYMAENPAVAKDYADKLSTVGWRRDDAFMDYDAMTMDAIRNDLRHNSLDDIVKQNKQYADSAKQTSEKSVMADMYNAIVSGDVGLNGNLYKADLPDEQIAKMLDYDKTWKQQPKNVQDAINIDSLLKYYNTEDMPTSQVLYHAKQNMSPVAFAEFLRNKGIPGIKYLDEGSRSLANTWIVKHPKGGENVFPNKESAEAFLKRNPDNTLIEPKVTRNFVVFPNEEKSMTILERNGLLADQLQTLPEEKKKEILSLLE